MATDQGIRTSIQFGDAPPIEIPPGGLERAARALRSQAGRLRARRGRNSDIEAPDKAGVHPAQAARETEVGGIAADRLRSIVERIERLEEERKALGADIKDIYAEAKSAGFSPKIVRRVVSLRKQEPAQVEEEETLLDLYRQALGM